MHKSFAALNRRVSLATSAPSIRVGAIVLRKAQLQRPLTEFESAYYNYREWVARDESRPFPVEFYFKKGTPGESRWLEFQNSMESLRRSKFGSDGPAPRSLSHYRIRELADIEARELVPDDSDHESLNRKLYNTLYLAVESSEPSSAWKFPDIELRSESNGQRPPLHLAAKHLISNTFGSKIDAWVVGKAPAGHFMDRSNQSCTFFLKSYVLSGRAQLVSLQRFKKLAWLTKDELERVMSREYYEAVEDLLVE